MAKNAFSCFCFFQVGNLLTNFNSSPNILTDLIIDVTFLIFSLIREVTGQSERGSSHNALCYLKTCARDLTLSLQSCVDLLNVSVDGSKV